MPVEIQSVGSLKPMLRPSIDFVISLRNSIVVSVGTQAFLVIVALVFLGIVVPAFLVIAVFLVTRVQLEQEKLLPIIILSLPEI